MKTKYGKEYMTELCLIKKCKICQKEKERQEFQKNCNSPDGLGCYCLECGRIRQNERYNTIPRVKEKLLEQSKKWATEHYTERKEKQKQRANQNPWIKLYYNIIKSSTRNCKVYCPINLPMEQLKDYFQTMFKDGINWENYGNHWTFDRIKSFKDFEASISTLNDLSSFS